MDAQKEQYPLQSLHISCYASNIQWISESVLFRLEIHRCTTDALCMLCVTCLILFLHIIDGSGRYGADLLMNSHSRPSLDCRMLTFSPRHEEKTEWRIFSQTAGQS